MWADFYKSVNACTEPDEVLWRPRQQNMYDNRTSIRTTISLLSQAHHLQLAADVVFVAVVVAAAAADVAV